MGEIQTELWPVETYSDRQLPERTKLIFGKGPYGSYELLDADYARYQIKLRDPYSSGDPRQMAYFALPRPFDYADDPLLQEELSLSGGSPAGHLCCVTSKTYRGFVRLASILYKRGHDRFEFVRDDETVSSWFSAMGLY